jgi:hypothetical protein
MLSLAPCGLTPGLQDRAFFFRPAAAARPLVDMQRGLGAEGGKRIPVRFQDGIHAIWSSLLAGDGYEQNRLQAGSYLPAG